MRDDDLDRLRKAFGQGRLLGTDVELECLLACAGDDAGDSELRATRGELVTEDDLRAELPAVDLCDGGLAPPRLAGDVRLDEDHRPSLGFDPPGEVLSHTDRRPRLRAFDHQTRRRTSAPLAGGTGSVGVPL